MMPRSARQAKDTTTMIGMTALIIKLATGYGDQDVGRSGRHRRDPNDQAGARDRANMGSQQSGAQSADAGGLVVPALAKRNKCGGGPVGVAIQ